MVDVEVKKATTTTAKEAVTQKFPKLAQWGISVNCEQNRQILVMGNVVLTVHCLYYTLSFKLSNKCEKHNSLLFFAFTCSLFDCVRFAILAPLCIFISDFLLALFDYINKDRITFN